MKKIISAVIVTGLILLAQTAKTQEQEQYALYDKKIDSILSLMTIHEKLGQLNALGSNDNLINPAGEEVDMKSAIAQGLVGVIQNTRGVDRLTELQDWAVNDSRLGIPILFAADIIHGAEVVFPIPLAEACSWDLDAIEEAARISAKESTALGLHMTYAPMADIGRDPRWGRVIEGAGEDTYLAAKVTEARVQGYQGDDLSSPETFGACVKHLAAYGAAEGGRDYNVVDMSDRRLRDVYLPPYQAAIDAGAVSVMVSFNEINGVPSSCNQFLLRNILRGEWGFKGFVIGDYTSVGELVNHGVAKDLKEAAELSINAGLDVDMVTRAIANHVPALIEEGKVNTETVDAAVKNVLRIKYALGIMDDPYLYLDKKREREAVFKDEYLVKAREMAKKSIVLLKNENQILPLSKDVKKIALIGPFVKDNDQVKGAWVFGGSHYESVVSLYDGIVAAHNNSKELLYAPGCGMSDTVTDGFKEALAVADEAEVIVVAIGEPAYMEGEAASRMNLGFPGVQLELLKALHKTGKPIIALVHAGRPLELNWLEENVSSIVYTWHLGHESGNAIADVLFGEYNPSGKLAMTFPWSVGQIPVYYNNRTTGRPYQPDYKWCSHYLDGPNTPLYPFGYGLSYTTFSYSNITVSSDVVTMNDTLTIAATIKNTGSYNGEEVVQLYVRDMHGSVTRPVKELKGFQKVLLAEGNEKQVSFKLTANDLRFHDLDMNYRAEPGEFEVYIGGNSVEVLTEKFSLIE